MRKQENINTFGMKHIVQGNYSKFRVTLTQKSGELIQPYIPTATCEVKISLRGERVYEYKEYEQAENVLTFSDNGCLMVGMYELEVRIIDSEQHRLRCMYREQVRVVASNDDIPTDASFETDDVDPEYRTVNVDTDEDGFVVTGKQLRKIFDSTNFNDFGSLRYLYKYIEKSGAIDRMKEMGLDEGDTIKVFDYEFEYYDEF